MSLPKLAISTLGCPNWTFQQILSHFHSYGISGIEVRGLEGEMEAWSIKQFLPENQAETKRLLKENGLVITDFGTSFSFHKKEDFPKNIEGAKRTIDICAQMDIPAIRIFGNNIPDKSQTAQIVGQVIDGMTELAEYGAPRNVAVLLEIHGDFNTAETIAPIVNAIENTPAAGILWDIAHSDKTFKDDFKSFYQIIRTKLRHIHVKDHLRNDSGKDWKLVKVDDGDIPIPQILKTVIDDGYDGFFSFEWEKKWHPDIPEPEEAFPHFVAKMRQWLA